jgi:autotransporter-associated beta strand protein
VTVSSGVNVAAGMTFSTDGYTLAESTITLTGGNAASNTITTATSVGATIASQLAGSGGMTKAGAGTLTFGGSAANTLTGTTTVSAGTLRLNKSAANAQLFTDGNMQTFVSAESSGSMPTGWAVSGGQVTGSQSPSNSPFVNIYGNNASSFRLNDAGSTAGTAGFSQAFSTTTNYQSISVNFDFMVPTLALTNLVGGAWGIQFDGGGAELVTGSSSVHYRIDTDGYFSIANNAGTTNIFSLTAGSWYNVQATFDLTATNTGTGNGAGFQSGSITQFGGATASWNNVALLNTSLGFSRLLVRDRSSFESGDLLLDNVSVVANADAIAGNLAVAAGATLLLSQSHQVNNNAAVTLSGGTIQRAGGVSEVFGSLDLTTGSFLDFGTGAVGNLTFGTYQNNQQTESALLTLNNFMPGNSFTFSSTSFSTNSVGSYFTFGTGYVDSSITNTGSTFTITAIPEPSTILAALGLAGLMLWPARRRLLYQVDGSRKS